MCSLASWKSDSCLLASKEAERIWRALDAFD